MRRRTLTRRKLEKGEYLLQALFPVTESPCASDLIYCTWLFAGARASRLPLTGSAE